MANINLLPWREARRQQVVESERSRWRGEDERGGTRPAAPDFGSRGTQATEKRGV